jgi:hypothetical protein
MHLSKKRKQVVAVSLMAVFLCLYVFTTNPRTLPAPMLLVPPLAVFVLCLLLLRMVVGSFTKLNSARLKAVVVAVSALPSLLLMLATAGQLGLKDALLTILFVGGLTWYFERSRQNISTAV